MKKHLKSLSQKSQAFLSPDDLHLFNEGRHFRLYEKLGAHLFPESAECHFGVWAPNAKSVCVVGDFNDWRSAKDFLEPEGDSGIWSGRLSGVKKGQAYKFHIISHRDHYEVKKLDPFAFTCETPPKTAGILWDLNYEWQDEAWLRQRKSSQGSDKAMSIYEIHLGSWRRKTEEGKPFLTYLEMAEVLPAYVKEMGFTHVEFMPVMEHPFYGSWGYQITGYFAPSSRYGRPQDFMVLIDRLHQAGIGVILDWVPSHFPNDEHGLGYFDGTHLFEHQDPRLGFHPDWHSLIFNYGRNEVRSFLISNALFWFDKYHVDGLRIDGVASMLYLDYSRKEGQWLPNRYGGRENLEAMDFLKQFNEAIYQNYPDVHTIAEESTAWPMASRPTYLGGLGFGMKWDMGWMHDTLEYFKKNPLFRKYHQGDLTFRMIYAFHENFILSLSHDEVAHGKGSIVGKMPGDEWQKFANLRALYAYMFAQPGKKLLFMGDEFGQVGEWQHESSLDWHVLEFPCHKGLKKFLQDLNQMVQRERALHELDFDPHGFEWGDAGDAEKSILSFYRKGSFPEDLLLIVCNFTPTPHANYRLGVVQEGFWREILNSDSQLYWGSGWGNFGGVFTEEISSHGQNQSLNLSLPPLGVIFLKWQPEGK